jgi:hypothetical protein
MMHEKKVDLVLKTILENNNRITGEELNKILNYGDELYLILRSLENEKYLYWYAGSPQYYYLQTKGITFINKGGYAGEAAREIKQITNSNKALSIAIISIALTLIGIIISLVALFKK